MPLVVLLTLLAFNQQPLVALGVPGVILGVLAGISLVVGGVRAFRAWPSAR